MRYTTWLVLPGLTAGLLIKNNKKSDQASFDILSGGYDKRRVSTQKTTLGQNGTSPAPGFAAGLRKRDDCSSDGIVQCSGYSCGRCGSCCGNSMCAENFGNCCDSTTACAFGFACCGGASGGGCCYQETSFCCPTSPTGCCLKGTECTPNGCVGVAGFAVSSITVTTILSEILYTTETIMLTSETTFLDTTTVFVTKTITSSDLEVASTTSFVTSTTTVAEETPTRYHFQTSTGVLQPRDSFILPGASTKPKLGFIGIRPETISGTSMVYSYSFIWSTYISTVYATSTQLHAVTLLHTKTSTISSIEYVHATSMETVVLGFLVTSTQETPSTQTLSLSKDNANSSDLTGDTTADIGAGVGVAVLALMVIVLILAMRTRRRRSSDTPSLTSPSPAPTEASWMSHSTPPLPPNLSHLDSREISYPDRAAKLASSMQVEIEQDDDPRRPPSLEEWEEWEDEKRISVLASPTVRYAQPVRIRKLRNVSNKGFRWLSLHPAWITGGSNLSPVDEDPEKPGEYHFGKQWPSPPSTSRPISTNFSIIHHG